MEANIFIGNNVGSLQFDFFTTMRLYKKGGVDNYVLTINSFFKKVHPIQYLTYNIEKGNDKNFYHGHLLYKIRDEDKYEKSLLRFLNIDNCTEKGTRKQIIKIKKDSDNVSDNIQFKDVYVNIDYKIFRTREIELYVEKIVSKEGCAYYANKFCNRGIVNGFLC